MREERLYQYEPGRVLDAVKNPVVPNVIALGHDSLQKALDDYNRAFSRLRERRNLPPLVGVNPYRSGATGMPVPTDSEMSRAHNNASATTTNAGMLCFIFFL